MLIKLRWVHAVLVVTLVTPASLHAQASSSPVTFSVLGGASRGPSSPTSARTVGYNIGAAAQIRTPLPLLRIRTEGTYADWGADRVVALTASAVVGSRSDRVAPYALAGGGVYGRWSSISNPGATAGTGLAFPLGGGRRVLLESRLHVHRGPRYASFNFPAGEPAQEKGWRTLWLPVSFGFAF